MDNFIKKVALFMKLCFFNILITAFTDICKNGTRYCCARHIVDNKRNKALL